MLNDENDVKQPNQIASISSSGASSGSERSFEDLDVENIQVTLTLFYKRMTNFL